MTRAIALLTCWAACITIAVGQKPDATADLKAMAGKWRIEEAVLSGTDAMAIYKGLKIEITADGKYTVVLGELRDVAKITIDPSKKPAEMDITGTEGRNKDKTIKTIYKLDGDTLTICYGFSGSDRPTKFEAKEKSRDMLLTYKREKK